MRYERIRQAGKMLLFAGLIGSGLLYASDIPQETNASEPSALSVSDPTAKAIRDRLEHAATPSAVARFYGERRFAPLWSREGQILPAAAMLSRMIDSIADEGLAPKDPAYHGAQIRALMQDEHPTVQRDAQLDLLLTGAFFALAHDLHYGRAYGADLNATNEYANVPIDAAALLNDETVGGDVQELLLSLAPQDAGYLKLRAALAYYRQLAKAGGWNTRAADYANEGNISRRLTITGDLTEPLAVDPVVAAEQLREAVKHFQRRHGITEDGIVGRVTAAKMALSPTALIKKIRLNMERWKWLPPHGDGPYVIVNVPGFELEVRKADTLVLKMRAIVGRRERETPIFASTMHYVVLNPYWRVPETILNEDIIPKLQADPHYLKTKHIKLFSAADTAEAHPLDPLTIDWKQWHKRDTERYIFREDPGTENPLGYVKFLFNNPYDVYIHDTPAKALFNHSNGSFSSGCIRVQKPIELARYVLALDSPEITYKSILAMILAGDDRWIRMQHPLPVYITYQTARVDDGGTVYFYSDIYGYDRKLTKYINKK